MNEDYVWHARGHFNDLIQHTFLIADRDLLAMLKVGDKLAFGLCLPQTRLPIKNAMFVVKTIDMERRLLTIIEDRD